MATVYAGIDSSLVFVGLICLRSDWDSGFQVAVERVTALIEANGLNATVLPYVIDDEALFEATVRTFIERSDRYTQRALIAGTTTNQLIIADNICRFRFIPVFSAGATATSIIQLTSPYACTWMPLNRNLAMFFFMLHCMYAREHAYVVYDLSDPTLQVDVESMLTDMRDQAGQFHLLLCFTTLAAIETLPENATILLLAPNAAIAAAGPTKLRCLLPNSSIVLMTAINAGARGAWFGDNVVPLCAVPYALDYTTTTRQLVEALGDDILTANAYLYALFDCMYSLAKFQLLTGIDLTVENLVKYPVQLADDVEPAFLGADSICVPDKSACFCRYSICYVRSNLLQNPAAYAARFDGGNPVFPDSLATLYQMSFTRNATTFLLETNRLFRLRSASTGALLLEKFDTDQIKSASGGADAFVAPVNGYSEMPLGVTLEFNASGIPVKLLDIQFFEGTLPVSPTMGKQVIEYSVSAAQIEP